jgi:acyl-CoA thioesterase-1
MVADRRNEDCHRALSFAAIVLALVIAQAAPCAEADKSKGNSPTSSSGKKPDAKKPPTATSVRRFATVPIEDDPKLPRVLLIGDSITMGYTLPVRELLRGQANVHFPFENCHTSRHILENFDAYVGDKPWDVINFNCGIHDCTLKDKGGKSIKAGQQGKPWVSIDEYRENLSKIIPRLQKSGATLIWCSSTPVADIFPHRKPADIVRYNAVAKEVMQELGIPITDLHAAVQRDGQPKYDDGAHFSIAGCEEMARDVAKSIASALAQRAAKNRSERPAN